MRKNLVLAFCIIFAVAFLSTSAIAEASGCNFFCKAAKWFAAKPTITGAATAGSGGSYQISVAVSLAPEKQKPQALKKQTPKTPEELKNLAKQGPINLTKPEKPQKPSKQANTPVSNANARLFDVSSDGFNAKWKSARLPPFMTGDIYEAAAGLVAEQITDSAGTATFDVSGSGKFMVIVKYVWTDANGASQTTYLSGDVLPNAFKDGTAALIRLFAKKVPIKDSPAFSKAKARWLK